MLWVGKEGWPRGGDKDVMNIFLLTVLGAFASTNAFAPTVSTFAIGLRLRAASPLNIYANAKPSIKSLDLESIQNIPTIAAQADRSIDRRSAFGLVVSSLATFALSLPASAKPTKATAEETIDAWRKLNTAKDLLATTDDLANKKDWDGIVTLLGRDEFKEIESTLLKLVNGPILNQDDKKTIGTRKRYGIAADVLFGIGGVQAAVAAISDPQLQGCSSGVCSGKFVEADVEVPKSLKSLKASLNEILTICKAYKEFTP